MIVQIVDPTHKIVDLNWISSLAVLPHKTLAVEIVQRMNARSYSLFSRWAIFEEFQCIQQSIQHRMFVYNKFFFKTENRNG